MIYAHICLQPNSVMILEGQNAILSNRKIMGATNPKDMMKHDQKLYGISIDKIQFMARSVMQKKKLIFLKTNISENFNNCFRKSFIF